jgi:hypothetical protein
MNPMSIPTAPRTPMRSPPLRADSRIAAQNGAVATSNAAIPLGTHCSAQTTARFPTQTRRNPTISTSRSSLGSRGNFSPRTDAMTRRISPAAVKRDPVRSIGVMVSTATRMAR